MSERIRNGREALRQERWPGSAGRGIRPSSKRGLSGPAAEPPRAGKQ
jgi:hypothetical protein